MIIIKMKMTIMIKDNFECDDDRTMSAVIKSLTLMMTKPFLPILKKALDFVKNRAITKKGQK